METLTTYRCEYCGEISPEQKVIAICEDRCARHKTFLDVKRLGDIQAEAYLDSIRLRACSIPHLFKIILDEEDLIMAAVERLHFVDKRPPPRMYNFSYEHVHFTNAYQPFKEDRMTHSSPIGKPRCPQWPKEATVSGLAAAVRINFKQKGNKKRIDIYEKYIQYIPGINTGTGGGCESVNIYLTLWKEDFPLMG
ncbi:hypothetical protein VPHD480_0251 [Vibrio phage D480]